MKNVYMMLLVDFFPRAKVEARGEKRKSIHQTLTVNTTTVVASIIVVQTDAAITSAAPPRAD
jgi:hypothetical protein